MTFGKNAALIWNTCIANNGNHSFTNMTDNSSRKRPRETDSCEFMPLSKRINNLHINNNLGNISHVQNPTQINGMLNLENGVTSPTSSTDSETRPSYDPGINSSDSTYYFDNKLLFELHLERIQRSGQQFPY